MTVTACVRALSVRKNSLRPLSICVCSVHVRQAQRSDIQLVPEYGPHHRCHPGKGGEGQKAGSVNRAVPGKVNINEYQLCGRKNGQYSQEKNKVALVLYIKKKRLRSLNKVIINNYFAKVEVDDVKNIVICLIQSFQRIWK